MINLEYYLLLGIATNATLEEIKIAYRKKAHELHPDKNKDFDTTEQFQQLNEAYNVLINFIIMEEKKVRSHDRGFYTDLGGGFIIKSYDKREVDIENYKIDIDNLSCNCSEWKNKRKQYDKNDARRLCRHIIASFDILEVNPKYDFEYEDYSIKDMQIPDNLKIFKDKIISCRDDRDGIDLYWFDELIILNSFIIYISKHKKGLHVFSKKHHKSMHVRLDCEDSYRTNIHIGSSTYSSYTSYYGDYNNNLEIIHKNKLSKYFFNDELKMFFHNRYAECTDFLELFDMDKYDNLIDKEEIERNEAWANGYLLVKEFEYSLPFFMNKNSSDNNVNYGRDIALKNIENKTKVYLLYQRFQRYLMLKDAILEQYDSTQNLLAMYGSDIKTRTFNSALNELGFMTKVKYVNRNNWIVKDKGLEFGMNYINTNFIMMHIKIPQWYKISYFDYETLSLQNEYRYGLLKMTNILWEKSKFNNLLKIIKNYLLTHEEKQCQPPF